MKKHPKSTKTLGNDPQTIIGFQCDIVILGFMKTCPNSRAYILPKATKKFSIISPLALYFVGITSTNILVIVT